MSDPVEVARQDVIANLEKESALADGKASDPFWQNGPFNVQRWVERGYNAAIGVLRAEAPRAGETLSDYLQRMSNAVRELRDHGPDADDEAWYASAIDHACSLIADRAT